MNARSRRLRHLLRFVAPVLVAALALGAIVVFFLVPDQHRSDQPGFRTSWIGNTLPGTDAAGHVQMNCNAGYVTADGRAICNSWWDESAQETGVYKDGKVVGRLQNVHCCGGYAVTGDASYLYLGRHVGDSAEVQKFYSAGPNSYGYVPGAEEPIHSGKDVRGLAVLGTELFAAVRDNNVVEVYRTSDLSYMRNFSVPGPTAMAADKWGRLWISTGGRVKAFNTSGEYLGAAITDTVKPTAVAFDPQGELLIGDDGWGRQQVYAYDVSGAPTRLETIGVAGGMYAGSRPGAAGPLRFNGITGVGKDSGGRLYVMQDHPTSESAGTGTNIDVYAKTGGAWNRAWQLLGLEFVDLADVDPSSYHNGVIDAYTADEHFRIDLRKPVGQQWTWIGQQTNRFGNPRDGRLLPFGDGQRFVPHLVTLGGQRFLAIVGAYSTDIHFYKFVPGTEFTTEVKTISNRYHFGSFDSNGDIWWSVAEGISRQKFAGLDSSGVPTYTPARDFGRPLPFNRIGRVRYDANRDALYVAGFTVDRPIWDGSDKTMGTVLARYDHWVKGNRTAAWTRILPYNRSGSLSEASGLGLVAMDVTNDGRIYASMLNGVGRAHQSGIYEYDQETGHLVAHWLPGSTVGACGWVDLVDGVTARTLPNGETLVFQEEDYRAKILMYQGVAA